MIKRKRKRNPLKDDKKLLRKVAEFLARAIEKEPDGVKSYLLAAELIRRDSLYCEECHSYDIEKDCDWDICYPEMDDLVDESDLDSAKEAAEDLAEDLGIKDYVRVLIYNIQIIKYEEKRVNNDLSGLNLSEIDLSKTYLYKANLSGANLSGANLSGADLTDVNLHTKQIYQGRTYAKRIYQGRVYAK